MKSFKFVMALFVAVMISSMAQAGFLLPANKSEKVGLTLPSGTAIYAMTIEGFDVGAGLKDPVYGISLNEDLIWGVQDLVKGDGSLTPIFGVGASVYVDGSYLLAGTGPLVALAGVNLVGPDIIDLLGSNKSQGLVPHILFVRDFGNGSCSIKGGLTLFTDLGPATAVKLTP